LNTSENTAMAACRVSVLNSFLSPVPHNYGSMSRIEVMMSEGKVVGKPRYPVGTSVATSNVADRLITAGNCVFAGMGPPYGQGEGGSHQPLGMAVISGNDPFKEGQYYVNQIFIGNAGNGAHHAYDGWITYGNPANAGQGYLDSIEVDESMYPILVEAREIQADTQGFGEFEGAPAIGGVFFPIDHDMTVVFAADGTHFPPRGVLGGLAAAASVSRKQCIDGTIVDLAPFGTLICTQGEKLIYRACGGGGYGNPADRPPERVIATVHRGWLTPGKANEIYGMGGSKRS
jgi:N-methylhydantoinase B